MNLLSLIVIGLVFCIVQFLVSKKLKKTWVKWLLIEGIIIGLLFCLIAYLNLFWTNSPSVISENQYLALILVMPFSSAFVGCFLGGIIYKLFCKYYK